MFFFNYFIKNPQTTIALPLLTHNISATCGVIPYFTLFHDLNNPLCSDKNEVLGPKVNIEESTDSDTSSASEKSGHAETQKSITLSKVPKSKDNTSAGPDENSRPQNTRTSSLEEFLPIPPKIPFSPISMLNKMFD